MGLPHYLQKQIIIGLMSLLISVLILTGCVYVYMVFRLPDVATLKESRLQIPLRIFTGDGQLIAEYGAMRRNPVSLDQVPKPLINAIIATEDQRFFQNSGIDFVGILRAARELLMTGQKSQGASTISMQVARNFFLTPEKTFSRKINEILLALKINQVFSKEKILELYINKIYLGQHAYGVSAAATIYYGKPLNQLSLAEMATIAGLPQAPSKENPITNPAAAKARRDHVLQRMLEMHHIDQTSYATALAAPIATYYHGPHITVEAPHVGEMVRNVIYQQFGEQAYTHGFRVYTTLNSQLQQAANQALRDGLIAYDRRHFHYRKPEKNLGALPSDLSLWQKAVGDAPQVDKFVAAAVIKTEPATITALLATGEKITISTTAFTEAHRAHNTLVEMGDLIRVLEKEGKWQLAQIPQVQGALIALRPSDGAILALHGGFNNTENGFNRATQAYRQPGSNFKPFIYAAALAKGYSLATIVNDSPIEINDTGDAKRLWRPQNDDRSFSGPTRLRLGLVKSLNLVTIRILQMVGIGDTIDYISRFGFDRNQLPPSLSLALGTASVAPIQIATGYSVFANGGYRVTPYFIRQIQAADSTVLYQSNPPTVPQSGATPTTNNTLPVPPRVIEPDIAYLMTDALQDVIRKGTGFAAQALKRSDIAGKTGTTNKQLDAWFSGFNPQVEATVWVGYDQPKPLHEYGGQAALPIWMNFMKVALAGTPQEILAPPDNIITVRIDPMTGLLAQPDQPDALFEMFRSDTIPASSDKEDTEPGADNDDGMPLF